MFSNSHDMECSSIESRIRTLTLGSENQSGPQSSSFRPTINSDCYYSVQDAHPDIILQLQFERMRVVLEQLEKERLDTTFSRNCLFCKKRFTVNRSTLMDHLREQHHFVIGKANNVVFIDELLDVLENMLKNLKCFFCEKIFKDWMTLKEHMRKKQHKMINPNNKKFDKYYLINYLEPGKRWIDLQREEDTFSQDGDEVEMDMGDQDGSSEIVCLYCDCKMNEFEKILQHMMADHKFDFKDMITTHKLKFYSQVKIINFIRRKIFEKRCTICDLVFEFRDDLVAHMTLTGHISVLPDENKWDQSMYYFPTFENDNLLCALEVDEDSDDEEEKMVHPETSGLPPGFHQEFPGLPSSACYSGTFDTSTALILSTYMYLDSLKKDNPT